MLNIFQYSPKNYPFSPLWMTFHEFWRNPKFLGIFWNGNVGFGAHFVFWYFVVQIDQIFYWFTIRNISKYIRGIGEFEISQKRQRKMSNWRFQFLWNVTPHRMWYAFRTTFFCVRRISETKNHSTNTFEVE